MGRKKDVSNVSIKDEYEWVCKYVETGNYTAIGREYGKDRKTISNAVKRWIMKNPEEYQKILDAFLMRNKQEMIFKNTHTTLKALNKVDEMLDDPDCCKNIKDVAIAYGTLYDKGALMKGESTQNSAIVIKMAGEIEELAK